MYFICKENINEKTQLFLIKDYFYIVNIIIRLYVNDATWSSISDWLQKISKAMIYYKNDPETIPGTI